MSFTTATTVSAKSVSTDPNVVVIADVTSPHCVAKKTTFVGTDHAVTTSTACLPGTFTKTQVLSQAQAIAQHKLYVLLPPPNASAADQKEFQKQLRQLQLQQRQIFRQGTASTQFLQPLSCVRGGSNVFSNVHDLVDGDELDLDVDYDLTRDCSQVIIDYNEVELTGNYNNTLYWNFATYNAGEFCCGWDAPNGGDQTVAPTNHTYSINIDSTQPAGDDFSDTFCNADTNSCGNTIGGGSGVNGYGGDIGILN